MTRPDHAGGPDDRTDRRSVPAAAYILAAPVAQIARSVAFQPVMARTLAEAVAPAARNMKLDPAVTRRIAEAVAPVARNGTIAAALGGLGAALRNDPSWAETMRPVVAALSSGVRRDLVDAAVASTISGALGHMGTPSSRAARPSKRRFAAAATTQAAKARTTGELGTALRTLYRDAGFSLNKLVDYVEAQNRAGANIVGLSKTTLSNACQGHRLFQTPEQVRHLVTICGAEADVDAWIVAWERVKQGRGRSDEADATTGALQASAIAEQGSTGWLTGPDDEVVIQIPVTRRQVRATVATLAILGLVASSTSSPAIRTAGLAVLGAAAGLALVDHTHTKTGLLPPAA